MTNRIELDIAGRSLIFETGRMARQADGACTVQYGGTVVLGTVVAERDNSQYRDFFPLTVDYREKAYAAGKIPGGFFKREGRPGDRETLICRLIDRPIRPLFPEGFVSSTHVVAFALSADLENDPDIHAVTCASAALTLSDVPFEGPVSAVRVGRINGEFILNPLLSQLELSDLNLIVAGTLDAVVMVEGGAGGIPDQTLIDAIDFAHEAIKQICQAQLQLRELAGKPKRTFVKPDVPLLLAPAEDQSLTPAGVLETYRQRIREAIQIKNKIEARNAQEELLREIKGRFALTSDKAGVKLSEMFHGLVRDVARRMILDERARADGRGFEEIRPITIEVGILPKTHGSALFTRGQTQALVVTTLGTSSDEQKIETIQEDSYKTFLLHYNFPPFSVGESGFMRGPGRREIGHGNLAERALQPIIPSPEEFPYTVRIVADILESNGSSSMASVCGGCLSLMDAGVQVRAPVAGIAMGLVMEGENVAILSDISGMEDHLGDMDFKVAGTAEGVTAVQMDIKIKGLPVEVLRQAIEQARQGRLFILGKIAEALPAPRPELSANAPRIVVMKINPDKIRDVIGPGGKIIKSIIASTGVKMDIEDDGTVKIAAVDLTACDKAMKMVSALIEEAEIGKVYRGSIRRLEAYGAFIEILPGAEGLLHISQVAPYRVNDIRDELALGDELEVKVIGIDAQGKIRLGRPAAEGQEAGAPPGAGERPNDRPPGGEFNRDSRPPRSNSGPPRDRRDNRGGPPRGDRFSGPRRDYRGGGRDDRRPYQDRPPRDAAPAERPGEERPRDDRPRDDRWRDDRPRDDRPRDDRPRDDRPRDDRPRDDRWRDDRPRDDRPRDDRPRDDRPRDDRPRDDRPRDDRPRDDRPRDDRWRDEAPRDDRPREERPREEGAPPDEGGNPRSFNRRFRPRRPREENQ